MKVLVTGGCWFIGSNFVRHILRAVLPGRTVSGFRGGQSYHMFYMLLSSLQQRQQFIAELRKREIHSVFHYVPLHLSAMGKRYGGREGACP